MQVSPSTVPSRPIRSLNSVCTRSTSSWVPRRSPRCSPIPRSAHVDLDRRAAPTRSRAIRAMRSSGRSVDRLVGTGRRHRSSGNSVVLLDTGVGPSHPDLAGPVVDGCSASRAAFNGRPQRSRHAMAGIIGGRRRRRNGVAGVALNSVAFLRFTCWVRTAPVTTATSPRASSGGRPRRRRHLDGLLQPRLSAALQAAVDYAWANDVVVVAARGQRRIKHTEYRQVTAELSESPTPTHMTSWIRRRTTAPTLSSPPQARASQRSLRVGRRQA